MTKLYYSHCSSVSLTQLIQNFGRHKTPKRIRRAADIDREFEIYSASDIAQVAIPVIRTETTLKGIYHKFISIELGVILYRATGSFLAHLTASFS